MHAATVQGSIDFGGGGGSGAGSFSDTGCTAGAGGAGGGAVNDHAAVKPTVAAIEAAMMRRGSSTRSCL